MESATLLEIDEATKRAATETRIKPAHCKFPVVGIPWQVIPYPNCVLARQEIGYVGMHLQLGEADVIEDVELRFSVKFPAIFLVFMLEGEITFINRLGKQVVEVKASHHFMAYSPRQTFSYRMRSGKHSILVIGMDIDWLLPLADSYPAFHQLIESWKLGLKEEMILPMCPIGQLTKRNLDNIRTSIIQSLEDVFKVPQSIKECLEFYHNLLNRTINRKSDEDNIKSLSKITEYINENFCLPTMCEEEMLARQLNISKWKIRDIVHRNWGTSIRAYVGKLRMEKAKWLLHNTDIKIREIAFECGYWDAAHFTHSFKKYYGSTPKDIRAKTKRTILPRKADKNCKFLCPMR